MTPRRPRSKKRSGASSTAQQRLEATTFYLDESIYSRALADRIRARGARVQHAGPGRVFPFGTRDTVWLTECGRRGWVVLMRDRQVRRRMLEREVLKSARVAAFVFTGGQVTAEGTAEVFGRVLQKLANIAVSEPRPFLRTVGVSGTVSRVKL